MSEAFQAFDSRLEAIARKRAQMERGYVGKVSKNGLIVFRPKRRRASVPVRGLVYVIAGFVFFKAVVIAHLGLALYEDRLVQLSQGSFVEQAGAIVMQPDRLSEMLAANMRPLLR
ncbi:MAG: hypothetical protein COW54_03650 [Rhodobacteraceae bacterium CG17_big_fil_post_rev_8_21_14_2_50_63_15]|nr:hypothetical protein [Roseovarius sp.]PIV79542.1 MAG: hypothetical protein COW54_03650 [Rhodobacteraceae bacterium CG17_big_fil_post_rev_8_21_14_2_50_63_15]